VSTPVRRALYGKLAGDSTLTGMLGISAPGYGQSIYHDQAPEEASYPFVVFSKSSGVPTEVFHTAAFAIETDVWLIKGVDRNTTADKVEAIADRLKTLLNDGTISISGYAQLYLRRQSDVEYPETEEGVMYKHCGSLYRLTFTNP
jgi:hypothetical protein